MWSLMGWDVHSPQTAPWWEAHHIDESSTAVVTWGKGHRAARGCSLWDSLMDSQDGALTCSLLTPMGFQEREEAWGWETLLTASAAVGDQPQGIVRIYNTGCPYCFNYPCIHLGPWCWEKDISCTWQQLNALTWRSQGCSMSPIWRAEQQSLHLKIILLNSHSVKRVYKRCVLYFAHTAGDAEFMKYTESSRCSCRNQHAAGNNETEKLLFIPASRLRTNFYTKKEEMCSSLCSYKFWSYLCTQEDLENIPNF